jgi:hypothetical protein
VSKILDSIYIQNQVVQAGVAYPSNPAGPQIYPSNYNGNTYPQVSHPTAYPPSSSSYLSQDVYGQQQPQYAPSTSFGQENPDIDPPNYDEATVNPVRKYNAWKF